MNKSMLTVSVLLMSAFATPAMAEEGRGSIGLGTYALISTPEIGVSDTFLGTALVGSYNFTSLLSVAGHFYALEDEVSPTIKMNGYDLMLRAGKNDLGFTYFGALGLYSETMSGKPLTFHYSGTLLGYGIGYNWESVNVTWEGSIRSTGDYESSIYDSYIVATGALNVSYRF